ncbi:serine/threonine-protein kinase [Streptomyces triticirhizae]|uniref:Protein kinase domain-containing protein n=1 Tax=Streptomyces triticirhizae TaxID=2483353 RepID=A0A3M2LL46_9ACTN|nr:serine/threonine-protein kinase [Streptomyces triticirhizae]RMI38131.1 hypothetical protein EBN88_17465 [Streptomyces triticirhizae]
MEPLTAGDPPSVGPYRLLGRLGAGGMGEVFLGRGPGGRLTAVKLIHAQLAADAEFRRRFQREVAAARRVSADWTAPVLDSDTTSAVPWVATGYLPGPSLQQVVDDIFGPLPEETVWSLAHGLARALADIHRAGLVHRDLKPSNVLVTLEGPRVIDFGIARAVDASQVTRTGSLVGSPGFMPPEQIRDESLTGAADVFALGAVLGFAATGVAPFSAGRPPVHTALYRVVHEEPELGPDDGPLTGALRELVARCLAKDPAERPSVAEVVGATAGPGRAAVDAESGLWLPATLTSRLGREAAGLLALDGPSATWIDAPPQTPPPTPPPPGPPAFADVPTATGPRPPSRSRRPVLIAAATAVVVLAAAVTWAVTRPSDGDDTASGSTADKLAPSDSATSPAPDRDDDARDDARDDDPSDDEERPGDRSAPPHELLPAEIREAGEITVRTAADYPPFLSHGDGDDVVGVEPDLAAEIGALLGVEFRYQRADYGSLLRQMHTEIASGQDSVGLAMGAVPIDRESEPAENLNFVHHLSDGWVLVAPEGRPNTLGELCDATLATWDSPAMEEYLAGWSEEAGCASPPEVSGHDELGPMLIEVSDGDADAALMLRGSFIGLRHAAESNGMAAGEPLLHIPRAIAVSGGDPDVQNALVEALNTLIENGTYAEVLRHWGAETLAVDEITVDVFDDTAVR